MHDPGFPFCVKSESSDTNSLSDEGYSPSAVNAIGLFPFDVPDKAPTIPIPPNLKGDDKLKRDVNQSPSSSGGSVGDGTRSKNSTGLTKRRCAPSLFDCVDLDIPCWIVAGAESGVLSSPLPDEVGDASNRTQTMPSNRHDFLFDIDDGADFLIGDEYTGNSSGTVTSGSVTSGSVEVMIMSSGQNGTVMSEMTGLSGDSEFPSRYGFVPVLADTWTAESGLGHTTSYNSMEVRLGESKVRSKWDIEDTMITPLKQSDAYRSCGVSVTPDVLDLCRNLLSDSIIPSHHAHVTPDIPHGKSQLHNGFIKGGHCADGESSPAVKSTPNTSPKDVTPVHDHSTEERDSDSYLEPKIDFRVLKDQTPVTSPQENTPYHLEESQHSSGHEKRPQGQDEYREMIDTSTDKIQDLECQNLALNKKLTDVEATVRLLTLEKNTAIDNNRQIARASEKTWRAYLPKIRRQFQTLCLTKNKMLNKLFVRESKASKLLRLSHADLPATRVALKERKENAVAA